MTNDEYLRELMSRGDGSLQAWFDAEHVNNTKSAKRAAAVERLRANPSDDTFEKIIAAVIGCTPLFTTTRKTRDMLIELLTDDDGLRNNDGVAAEHGATRMTNLERLFVDSEQFRQAVSAFAFAHSDDCPSSPTQMVDWLMAPHVDAQSKAQSKDAPTLSEQSESLSDANDDLAPESDVTADAVDANDENATCNNSGDFVTDDSREKLEADVLNHVGLVTNRDTVFEWLNRQAAITRKTEQAAWIQQANGLIHEANVRANELREELAKRDKGIARLKRQRDEARRELEKNRWEYCETCEHAEQVDRLEAECDKLKRKEKQLSNELGLRDKAIEMLLDVKQELIAERDRLQGTVDNLRAECDESCVYKQEWRNMDKLEAERDALAADLRDCERERERLRQALGTAIDHAHDVVSLVNLDGEVIG